MIATKNESELAVAGLLEDHGYKILKCGWPDFAAWRESDHSIRFLEIKPKGAKLRKSQQEMKKVFDQIGMEFTTIEVGKAGNHSYTFEKVDC